jgi:hypothetical protein
MNPDGSQNDNGKMLEYLDYFFTGMFTIELCMNLYCNWLRDFFASGWNILDLIVVCLSLIALGPMPIPVSIIRMSRVFRVIRLFGRFESLSHIVLALTKAIQPVLNAFSILLIFVFLCEPSTLDCQFRKRSRSIERHHLHNCIRVASSTHFPR